MKTFFYLIFLSTSQNPFHYSHSEDFPLFSEAQIISPLLQKATPLLGFKTKGQGQAGWEEEDGRGQTEKKGDTQRGRKGDRRNGKGRVACGEWGGRDNETRQENVENGVIQRRNVCSMCFMCWRVIMRRT